MAFHKDPGARAP